MNTKEFYEYWNGQEIDEYIRQFSVLVLFQAIQGQKEARLVIYGKFEDEKKDQLKKQISTLFGGFNLSSQLCNKINEYAEKWYNKFVLKKQARVINFGRRHR